MRAAAAMVVDAEPLRDDGHPRIEATLPGEGRHRPQRSDEGLLGELLGDVLVADPPLAVAVQPVEVAPVQIVERVRITGLVALHQITVTLEIDIVRSDGQRNDPRSGPGAA